MSDQTSSPSRTRRPAAPWVGWVVALVGILGGLAFGVAVIKLPLGAPLVMLGLGGLSLALIARALWNVLNPLARPEAALPEPPRAPARLRELEREKQLALKAIKEIELDFKMRKISAADYKDLTERYRGRAMRLIQELDAGDDWKALIEQELKHRLAAARQNAPAQATQASKEST